MSRSFTLVLLLVSGCTLVAAAPANAGEEVTKREYLQGIAVRCLTRNAEAIVWIGTGDGANV